MKGCACVCNCMCVCVWGSRRDAGSEGKEGNEVTKESLGMK